MTHRQYRDEQDVEWQVWDIHPMEVTRRLNGRPNDAAPAGLEPIEATTSAAMWTRMAVSGELAGGWLCFESAREKRRLWPIPSGWELLSDMELKALCASAAHAPERKRQVNGSSTSS